MTGRGRRGPPCAPRTPPEDPRQPATDPGCRRAQSQLSLGYSRFPDVTEDRVSYRTALIGLSWIAADPARPASDPVLGTAVPFSHASAMAAIPEIEGVAGCDIVAPARCPLVQQWSG